MATAQAIVSIRVQDAVGVVKAYEEYVTYDDATATLASLLTAVQLRVTNLDNMTDGKVLSSTLRLFMALPGGIKADPVAGSDCEETGLVTFITSSPGSKVYSLDIPAISQDHLVGRTIDITTAASHGLLYVTTITSGAGTLRNTDNKWGATLDTAKSGQKTFRKLRAALKRA